MSSETPVTGYDITISSANKDYQQVALYLKEWCKKWGFQHERGESGYEHFQCRVWLMKKKRFSEIKKLVSAETLYGHWSITSATCHQGCNFNYVLKADTRIAGPWKDTEYTEPPPLTPQLENFIKAGGITVMPWMAQVEAIVKTYDERSITLIYDEKGTSAKSIFCEYLEYHNLAFEIPPLRSCQDIMQLCMSIPAYKCYLVDMPRGMKKDKLAELYSGLECLKNGKMYDIRYAYKSRRITRPGIIVFTNMLPNFGLLSPGRWDVWIMTDDKSLKKFEIHHNSGSEGSQFAAEKHRHTIPIGMISP
eukprot:gene32118-40619_t